MEIHGGDRLLGQYVSYAYTGMIYRALSTSNGEILDHDRFTFRLHDFFDAPSIIGVASLAIISRLSALTTQSQNDPSWICTEDVASRINLYAQDSATGPRDVSIIFSAVPQHGSLLRWGNHDALSPGDTLDSNCTDNICVSSVKYLPEKNYFNSPISKWNEEVGVGSFENDKFSFYAIANHNGEYSSEVVQEIQVINSNDPSSIGCPEEEQNVRAVGAGIYASGAFVPLDRKVVTGIFIVDPDEGLDIVKIRVSARHGLLSLHDEHIHLLDFISLVYCYEGDASQCSGSGTSDRELIFFAEPSYAQMALDGMVYQSMVSNIVDSINITVFDGANGDCLDEAKFKPGSIREGCLRNSCAFNVAVGGHDLDLQQTPNNHLSVQVWISGGISVCVVACITFKWFV